MNHSEIMNHHESVKQEGTERQVKAAERKGADAQRAFINRRDGANRSAKCPRNKRRLLLRVLMFLPAVVIAVMIFGFSSQDAEESSRLSTEVTAEIVRSVNRQMNKGWTLAEQARMILTWEHYVRKVAHFGEYTLFGLSLSIPMYVCGIRRARLPLIAGLISLAYAALDEFHQNFSYGRSPQPGDVLIDFCGAMTGILLGWLIAHAIAEVRLHFRDKRPAS